MEIDVDSMNCHLIRTLNSTADNETCLHKYEESIVTKMVVHLGKAEQPYGDVQL